MAALTSAAAVTAGASIYGAYKQSSSADKGAKLQVDAANRAAAFQADASDKALAYTKEQDAYERASSEATRRGNYDQWSAQRERLGTLGQMLGLPGPRIPDYVPIQAGGPPQGAPGRADGPLNTPDSTAAWAKFDAMFPGETLTPQMLSENKAALEKLGFTLRPNAKGVVGKIQYGTESIADVIQGADSGVNKKQRLYGGPAKAAPRAGTIGALAGAPYAWQPATPHAMTPALQMPHLQYPPRTLGDYATRSV